MKNILIISDNFSRGGLETHIATLYEELKGKVRFTFIFGYYNNQWNFDDSKIYEGISFNESSSINDFKNIVNKLSSIINENNIDFIHVHPFYLTIPAVFAAEINNIPIAYTYHGFASLTFTNTINFQTVFTYSLNNIFSKIFCVYTDVVSSLKKQLINNDIVFMPNPIDLKKYKKVDLKYNGSWVMTLRIDKDKINSVMDIINSLDSLSIKKLHIYGSGSEEEYLSEYIKNKKLDGKVFLHGYTNNIRDELNGKYNGLIGMGRSAAEAVAMNIPVMLVGYGKNCGIINKTNYINVKNSNFAPVFLESLNIEEIKQQVEKIKKNYKSDIYDLFSNDCSSKVVAGLYFEEICNSKQKSFTNIKDLFYEINKIDSNECFSTSKRINKLLDIYILNYSIDISFNSSKIFYDDINKILDTTTLNLYNSIQQINNRINTIDDNLNTNVKELYDHINLKFLIFKTIEKIKKRKKKKL